MAFNKYPYTDQHEINLDWFLGQFKNLKKLVEDLKKIVINAPDASSATAGQAPIADGQGGWAWGDVQGSGSGGALPSVTTSDNGKFLRVVSGAWAVASVPSAESEGY